LVPSHADGNRFPDYHGHGKPGRYQPCFGKATCDRGPYQRCGHPSKASIDAAKASFAWESVTSLPKDDRSGNFARLPFSFLKVTGFSSHAGYQG
jgi:hypothetical protein